MQTLLSMHPLISGTVVALSVMVIIYILVLAVKNSADVNSKAEPENPEIDSTKNLRKLWTKKELPEDVRKELEKLHEELKSKGEVPTENCLPWNIDEDLEHNNTVTFKAETILRAVKHVADCKWCSNSPTNIDPKLIIKRLSNPSLHSESLKNLLKNQVDYYEKYVLPAYTHLSFSELEALQQNRDITIKAMDIVAKAWHISKCDSCKTLLSGAGLL